MTKNEQLNILFKEWKMRYEDQPFCFDGIIDESKYQKSKPKILYITKEPNGLDRDEDYRVWWNDELAYAFSFRIAEWSHGILNGFPPFSELWSDNNGKVIHPSLKSIALLNVKKTAGKGTSKKIVISEHIKNDIELIQKQINIIDPDLIIMGLSWDSCVELIFPHVDWSESGYDVSIGKHKNAKVIDFYHPSARNAPSAVYSLLGNVLESKAFKSL